MNKSSVTKARSLIRHFKRSGISVLSVKKAPTCILIEIDTPPVLLKKQVIEIVEVINGERRIVYTVKTNGCMVTWRSKRSHLTCHSNLLKNAKNTLISNKNTLNQGINA
ncbi:hypothetical protein [Moritella viscosa]|uniref:4-hydroxy-3-methylbut-2-en-1-yl diphosphate synthase-1-hydroxy-2-methyl-2-(E)-butenyl 4-diphosphate synthase n=1 Tax=Moritella viscosa TaxID=80854 RepID=A0ABY1H9C3_9GAMM|nr:hypothetical protein [Moritella viscosa]CED61163.1 bacteriophage Mu-like cim protein [Moritella viscosa]SGY85200.1 4-hydroxy-3-methylbut-2-en-1-yl diphosphate synthase-1-hydroxy-2-methyl-2-(E)-butenyl 4-diphosphate synthase [Moritella viscosa]SGY87467.1 4-hydroxy-3-methylbut-2-en-1-yl diphosphate synthase-1-hydroxy-2-methyl-2-(E)-butenyl 4-diphosphate synthase [Moritella viscosa]SHN99794.1 4-hydroxy-3-methylbut-2-en-1-yl diphosphate synthase-1-hydroxy-2-methyl-2-(E)-butenyl 4-diphosphate syn